MKNAKFLNRRGIRVSRGEITKIENNKIYIPSIVSPPLFSATSATPRFEANSVVKNEIINRRCGTKGADADTRRLDRPTVNYLFSNYYAYSPSAISDTPRFEANSAVESRNNQWLR